MYHHTSKRIYHGFPDAFPDYVEKYLQEGILKLLPEKMIDGKTIFRETADKAVEVIESVYLEYREEHRELIEYVSDTLKSPTAENIFKKELCNRLAEFYSVNLLLMRIEKVLGSDPILFYPKINVHSYLYLKALISRANLELFEHPNIRFPVQAHITSVLENLKEQLLTFGKLSAQTVASGLLGSVHKMREKTKKNYLYGVSVVAPLRQLTDNQRGPGFIIDNNKISAEDVVYFPIIELNNSQKSNLEKIPGSVYYLPKPGQLFSHFNEWKNLLWLALRNNLMQNGREINIASNTIFNYFRWKRVMEDVGIKHFITHCDFSIEQIGRNIALTQAGVQTWYFTDSMNHGCIWKVENERCGMRLPFWTYLSYDHLITWNELLDQYFKDHPGSFRQIHVVGCLWNEHTNRKNKAGNQTANVTFKNMKISFKLVAFDTTYSKNGFASYDEGLVFALHLLKLVDDYSDIHIILKEKKNRNLHSVLDPVIGPKLLGLYKKMGNHPRITTYLDYEDSSELISISDMVISFPFTSTTFEALSVNKPAIWHDPMGYYRDTPYAEVGGVTTHSYEELREKVIEIKNMKPGTYQNPIEIGSPLMDPYRDGKAIDRFRELLISFTRK
jgi:polysaccharide biosynthesis PFTS motif protein